MGILNCALLLQAGGYKTSCASLPLRNELSMNQRIASDKFRADPRTIICHPTLIKREQAYGPLCPVGLYGINLKKQGFVSGQASRKGQWTSQPERIRPEFRPRKGFATWDRPKTGAPATSPAACGPS